jgi:hypothetical protein
MPKLDFCALCKEQKTLVDSHVVPKFFLRAVTSEKGQRKVFVMKFGDKPGSREVQEGSFERHDGLIRKLLCSECDAKIGTWEGYARNVLYGNCPGPDIKKREIGKSIADQLGPHNAKLKDFRDCCQTSVDYKKFNLFELSILWRAGLEKKTWGKDVNLGPFQEDLREHLLNDIPGPALYLPVILVHLRDPGVAFEALLPPVELLHKRPSICTGSRLAVTGGCFPSATTKCIEKPAISASCSLVGEWTARPSLARRITVMRCHSGIPSNRIGISWSRY